MFDEYASGKPRPYSVVLMLTAEHLMEQSNLQLSKILSEFKLTANAYKEQYAAGSKARKVAQLIQIFSKDVPSCNTKQLNSSCLQ